MLLVVDISAHASPPFIFNTVGQPAVLLTSCPTILPTVVVVIMALLDQPHHVEHDPLGPQGVVR